MICYMIQMAATASSGSEIQLWTLGSVVLGALIAMFTQLVLHRLTVAAAKREKSEAMRAASRMLRDDLRSTEARIYYALKENVWWRDDDIAPQLHSGEDLRIIVAHMANAVHWGDVATARRTMLRLDTRRRANRPVDRVWLIKCFRDLEAARALLAKDVEGFTLKPIQWADEVKAMTP
jgi:hypothetical protein